MKKSDTTGKIVQEVIADFEGRKTARRPFELQWQLNIDFMRGNQNNYISNFDTVTAAGKQFYWQQREVFNHISPLIETRLGKLAGDAEVFSVVPLADTDHDARCAEKCTKIVKSAFKKAGMTSLVDQANMWAELTGTAFYKVVWDNNKGLVGEGDVTVVVCSPFEIYPENLSAGDANETSIIHAKAYTTAAIKKFWGVDVAGADIEVHDFNRTTRQAGGLLKNACMVIERYKDGRLTIVAGDKLLYDGEHYDLPFVRQTSESFPGSFFGRSVIERAIPVQRAYNAVKNRKTEFLNRLACGVVAVEDGSVDIEALENDGLAPGTVIVYRQGTTPPKFVEGSAIPAELEREEERLLREFALITGGTDIARTEVSSISGVALEIMVQQDKHRIRRAIVSGKNARAAVASHILRLYKHYATAARLERLVNGRCVELFTWTNEDITSQEVTYDNN